MLSPSTTRFVGRLQARDPEAWFELWETFGPVIRARLARWGRGRIGPETVQDLTQETLAALADAIDRHDPSRGARFSTWLLAIARHMLSGEMDRRNAQKRGSGRRPSGLEPEWMEDTRPGRRPESDAPDEQFERAVFRAKVEAAFRKVEKETDFVDFSVYRMRILDGRSGKEVAEALGTSEATVSRRLSRVREALRERLAEVMELWSFTPEEREEAERKGLAANPKKADDHAFDQALAEILHAEIPVRPEDPPRGS